jgi:hypothetical protein
MTESLMPPEVSDKITPEMVAPLVTYLCHRSNEATGNIFSVGGGRFARVRIGVTPGIISDEPTPDYVADNIDRILGEEELVFPQQVFEEIALMLQAQG